MRERRLRIHWAWFPAAVVLGAGVWVSQGWRAALLAVALGLALAAWAELRARRRG